MPGLDGFGVIDAIDAQPMPQVVFVTAHDQFALRAFEVHALDYLLKPFDLERFRKFSRARAQLQRNKTDDMDKMSKLLKEIRDRALCRAVVNQCGRARFLLTGRSYQLDRSGEELRQYTHG
jgi:two-component system LytT family response regulator